MTLQIRPKKIIAKIRLVTGLAAIIGTFGFSSLIVAAFLNPKMVHGVFYDAVWVTMFMMVIGIALVKTMESKK